MHKLLIAALAALFVVPAWAGPQGEIVSLQGRIVCQTTDHVRQFFDLALEAEKNRIGIAALMAGALQKGVICVVGGGSATYEAQVDTFVWEHPKKPLEVFVHEVITPGGMSAFVWTTKPAGEQA